MTKSAEKKGAKTLLDAYRADGCAASQCWCLGALAEVAAAGSFHYLTDTLTVGLCERFWEMLGLRHFQRQNRFRLLYAARKGKWAGEAHGCCGGH